MATYCHVSLLPSCHSVRLFLFFLCCLKDAVRLLSTFLIFYTYLDTSFVRLTLIPYEGVEMSQALFSCFSDVLYKSELKSSFFSTQSVDVVTCLEHFRGFFFCLCFFNPMK